MEARMFGELIWKDVFVYNGRSWQVMDDGTAFCPGTKKTAVFPSGLMVDFVGNGFWPVGYDNGE